MSKSLVVALGYLAPAQRERIESAAKAAGFAVLFETQREKLLPALAEAEIVFGLDDFLSKNAPKLRWLCTPSAGVNQFAAPGAFASPDAVLTNSSGAYGVTIAEHTVMLILDVLRRQQEEQQAMRRREWLRGMPVRSIHSSRIAILGTGDLGREAAVRLRAFSPAEITGVNRSGRNPDESLFDRIVPQGQLDAVLPGTDLLIITLPGTAETEKMLDARRLALLPDGAVVVNVGRGTVIDQAALVRELNARRLYAALDVYEAEPLPQDDPLWSCPNLLMTPHTAGDVTLPLTVERIVSFFLEDFDNYCAGRPLKRQVALQRGY